MEKIKKVISDNKFIILLTIVALTAAIAELICAYYEADLENSLNVSSFYGIRDIIMIFLYACFILYFSITLKKRRRLEFVLALILLFTAMISYFYINDFTFRQGSPENYYRLVYANPFYFKISHYKVKVPGGAAELYLTNKVITLNFIAAMIAIATCVTSIIFSINKKYIDQLKDKK